MNGRQAFLDGSLQVKLSAWLTMVIGGVALAVGVFSFGSSLNEANELQDDQLRQIAAMVRRQHMAPAPPVEPVDAPDVDPESLFVFQLLARPGQPPVSVSGTGLAFRADMEDGVQTVSVNRQPWRVVVETLSSGTRFVVGQRTSVRDQIARASALRAVLPFIVLIPLLLLLVRSLIRTMLKPVKALARDIDQREQNDLRAMSEADIPTEIRPFVVAINSLLSRVAKAMAGQRRLLADAAHELRTALTALSLQAELLGDADMSAQARQRLVALQSGLLRSRQLLEQLLALARVQEGSQQQLRPVYVRIVFLRVAEDLMPLARAKGIDLGMVGEQDHTVLATEVDIFTLVKCLVDNAIRHTQPGGKIDLSVRKIQGRTELLISASGPGIPEDTRTRAFDPFCRSLGNEVMGSGESLSIVQTIVQRVGAQIHLEHANAVEKTGLRVVVSFSTEV